MRSDAIVSFRVAGAAAPRHVLRALARSYPHVRLAWNTRAKRWVMLQRLINGAWEPFRVLGDKLSYEAPNMKNTVGFLGWLEARLRSRHARAKFLAEMDATAPHLALKRDAERRVHEGNREMVKYVLTPTLRLPVHGLRRRRK